jgi:osmoprotectant transport system permease protein
LKRSFFVLFILFISMGCQREAGIAVGSKAFTESIVLAEIFRLKVAESGQKVTHKQALGGSRVLFEALLRGDIDFYPEYTGTIAEEFFGGRVKTEVADLRRALKAKGLNISQPLGFNNTYALGMSRKKAERLGIATISDLNRHPSLRLGFSNEFMDRKDCWPGLLKRYQCPQKNVTGMHHDLSYKALAADQIDVVDLYSTDAEIDYYDLIALTDDRHYFPDYRAVILYREQSFINNPGIRNSILSMAGRIPAAAMIGMNKRVKLDKRSSAVVAAVFLKQAFGIDSVIKEESVAAAVWRQTREHLDLVIVSLTLAIFISLPVGIYASKLPRLGQFILGLVGLIQTIPSLALLVFMIPLFGIGRRPAIFALFLYSLLPIVRNTYLGLRNIPGPLKESAQALGLTPFAKLRYIELPLAFPAILAGIKTSAVINVGTATLGALIGAGGYGQPILAGIRLDRVDLILQGAIPAAVLALLAQGFFELLERMLRRR